MTTPESRCGEESFVDGEYILKLGDQWYYRGNRSPRWLFVASRADGSCQGGISEPVPKAWWPLLDQIGARLASSETKCSEGYPGIAHDLETLRTAATAIRDNFTYDPGHSDLDNEQPIHISTTLGAWRKLNYAIGNVDIERRATVPTPRERPGEVK